MTIIVPIGVDCGVSFFCQALALRKCALPFDWTVSYNGVSKCIDEQFQGFTDLLDERLINRYDVYFHHDFAHEATRADDQSKYDRRCARLLRLLETTTERVVFCRKGHSCHHHDEHDRRYRTIVSDLEDCERLHGVLSSNYPRLSFEIVVFLLCGRCFTPEARYESAHANVAIYNIAAPEMSDHHRDYATFEECARRCPALQRPVAQPPIVSPPTALETSTEVTEP